MSLKISGIAIKKNIYCMYGSIVSWKPFIVLNDSSRGTPKRRFRIINPPPPKRAMPMGMARAEKPINTIFFNTVYFFLSFIELVLQTVISFYKSASLLNQ